MILLCRDLFIDPEMSFYRGNPLKRVIGFFAEAGDVLKSFSKIIEITADRPEFGFNRRHSSLDSSQSRLASVESKIKPCNILFRRHVPLWRSPLCRLGCVGLAIGDGLTL
jgi:hypothetical protein